MRSARRDRTLHARQGLRQRGARAAEVETQIRSGLGPEIAPVGQADAMALKMGDGIRKPQRSHVEPGEVGGLDRRLDADARQFARKETEQKIPVAAQMVEKCAAPGFSVAVGGLAGGIAEAVDLRHDSLGGVDELAAQGGVGNDREGGAEPR